jgi:hypothetical protein
MYQRAEVRASADAIGLDPHVALAALGRTQTAPQRAAAVRPSAQRARARARRTRRRTRLAGMAVLLLAIPVAVVGYLWRQPQDVTAVTPSNVQVETVPPVAAPDAAADPQPGRAADATPPQRSAGPAEAAPRIFEYPELRVITDPPGARVTVDGVGWGQSPLTIRALRAGTRLVRVTLDGYATQQRRVVMPDDAPRTTVRITLRPAR